MERTPIQAAWQAFTLAKDRDGRSTFVAVSQACEAYENALPPKRERIDPVVLAAAEGKLKTLRGNLTLGIAMGYDTTQTESLIDTLDRALEQYR